MEKNENSETIITEEENTKQETFDVAGLLIGALVGIIVAILGVTNILMGIIVGMFFGLVAGTFIKKK